MKRLTLPTVFAAFLLVCSPTEARANYAIAMTEKLLFGVANVIYAPTELLTTPVAWAIDFDRNQRFALTGFVLGIPAGFTHVYSRSHQLGLAEIATFPLVGPERHRRWTWLLAPPYILTEHDPYDGRIPHGAP